MRKKRRRRERISITQLVVTLMTKTFVYDKNDFKPVFICVHLVLQPLLCPARQLNPEGDGFLMILIGSITSPKVSLQAKDLGYVKVK